MRHTVLGLKMGVSQVEEGERRKVQSGRLWETSRNFMLMIKTRKYEKARKNNWRTDG